MHNNEEQRDSQQEQPEYPQLNRFSMLLTRRGEEFVQRFATSPPPDSTYHQEPSSSHLNPSSESVPRGYHQDNYGYMEDNGQYTYHVDDDPMSGESEGYYEDGGVGYSGTEEYDGTTRYGDHDQNFNVVYSKAGGKPNQEQVSAL